MIPTVISTSHPSWLRYRRPYPTHRFQESSQTWALSTPRIMLRWHTSKRRTSKSPSVINWGRNMCMKTTCIISPILFWVRQLSNYRRRWYRNPPSRRWRQSNTLLDNWLSSRSSAFRTNLNNIPPGLYLYVCQPSDFTTPYITTTITWPIPWSGYGIHRRSTRHVMLASYQRESKNTEWRYCIYCMSLTLMWCWNMRLSMPRHYYKRFSAPCSTLKTQKNPYLMT